MSEYHAAVGLASLDGWAKTRQTYLEVANRYHWAMEQVGLGRRCLLPPDIGLTYAISNVRPLWKQHESRTNFDAALLSGGCGMARGCRPQTYFADLPRETLNTTEEVMPRLLGLPMAPDLTDEQIAHVVARIVSAIKGCE